VPEGKRDLVRGRAVRTKISSARCAQLAQAELRSAIAGETSPGGFCEASVPLGKRSPKVPRVLLGPRVSYRRRIEHVVLPLGNSWE